ncbi:MAG: EcsC family protein [Armatimonadetes bacterium]|nr:EcsC family protein [Armatimonadota bacterium]
MISADEGGGSGRDWVDYLTERERARLRETEEWITRPQGLVGRAMAMVGKPLDFAYSRVPEAVKDRISESILSVLTGVRTTSQASVSQRGILDRLSAAVGFEVIDLPSIHRLDVDAVDRLAGECLRFNKTAGFVEGGAAGAAGLMGLAVDIPALYLLVFRTVQEISLCYGFPIDSPAEVAHILKVVDVGHYLESESKRRGMIEIESIQSMIRQGAPIKDLERAFVAKGLQALARHLSTQITRRKLAQTVAIVGSVIGASVNYQLVADVGETAFHAYRRRFLVEVAYLRMAAQVTDV